MSDYSKVPASATLKPTPFEVKIDDATLNELKILLKNAKLPKDTYENETEDGTFGVSKGWVSDTVDYWAEHFDWRQREARINSFPHFKVPIKDDDGTVYDIHFVALFSQKQDALPVLFFHGWPGSFLEFLPLLDLLRTKYTPETLPYHIIVPSIPGFTYSELPVLERDFSLKDVARLFNSFVLGLGFERYVVQGGDLGSGVATLIGSTFPACKAVHLNCSFTPPPEGFDFSTLTDKQKAGLARGQEFHKTGMAYAIMHATRPSTIGIVLSSSPVALLAWIGEKFVAWSDETPSLDAILESITLYWATNTYPSSIYAYREWLLKPRVPQIAADGKPETYIRTYLGYSNFPKELGPQPKEWIERNGNLVSYKDHEKGGHFAALEEPEQLLQDVEEFISIICEKI